MALEKQMELFEEGGLMQEGGTVDEESGNDVPVGSLKKEVRDDIPAQLSEGEFVMPADVVRFHGLDKMMALRDEAKMGLQRMEDMGQMGNADEAIIPDGVPFSIDDLDIEDEPVEMQVGGFVQPPVVGMPTPPPMPSQFAERQPQYTPYQVPTYGGYQPPQPQAVPTAPTGLPSFSDFVTPKYELYVNDAGNTISIPVDANGNPLIPVPAGYKKQSDTTATAGPTSAPTTTGVQTATVTQEDDNEPPQTAAEVAEMRARVSAAKRLGITEQVGFSLGGAFGRYGPEDEGKFTPTGYIIGKDGVLLDPLTGMIREQGSPFALAGILDAVAGKDEPSTPGYSQPFFDALPDQAKDALGRSLGKDARDKRFETIAQRQRSFEDRLREMENLTRAPDIPDEERGIDRAVDVSRTNRASLRAQIARERQDEIRQTKNDIATVQAQARAEIASQDTRQQAAERAQREARERQEDRNEGGSGQTLQEKADSYTADRVSEAIATGDFSRGFAEGGLASKPKPKAKKKMKQGGLASKK
tara:strand:+ start:2371 stop:3957 length:1587 start_codon:yes stop_codon:yes gene_type:complete